MNYCKPKTSVNGKPTHAFPMDVRSFQKHPYGMNQLLCEMKIRDLDFAPISSGILSIRL